MGAALRQKDRKRGTDFLLVDDSDRVRNSLQNRFKSVSLSYATAEAKGGEETFYPILKEPHSIILMDIGLPAINGIEASRGIKTLAPETRVVMFAPYEDA
jgi:two-component system, NarL family, invasion response regulator UvrY